MDYVVLAERKCLKTEPGNKEINIERTEEALRQTRYHRRVVCNTMMTDGVKTKEKSRETQTLQLIANAEDL
jgi:hypothetical protein